MRSLEEMAAEHFQSAGNIARYVDLSGIGEDSEALGFRLWAAAQYLREKIEATRQEEDLNTIRVANKEGRRETLLTANSIHDDGEDVKWD